MVSASTSAEGSGAPSAHGMGARQPTEGLFRRAAPRLSRGELGTLPVVTALVIIAVFFQLENSNFLSTRNLYYLTLQFASLSMYALGAMLVLLIAEIDLSIGSVSGFTGAVLALLITNHGWPAGWAIVASLALGAGIGAAQGLWVVLVRVPSFIVTLTGLLVWQGCQFLVLGNQGAIAISDTFVSDISSTVMSHVVGVVGGAVVVLGYAAYTVAMHVMRSRNGYDTTGVPVAVGRIVAVAIFALGTPLLLNRFLGTPVLLSLIVVVTVGFGVMISSTPFGTHMYAVGGNPEGARRAGIKIGALRVSVFVFVGTLAALGGIIDASRGMAASVTSGGGNTTLDAIAAAVIGGTSLFGGRGRPAGALLGALVIGAVTNGLDLVGESAAIQTIVTGLILIVAVSIDVTARRAQLSVWRAFRRKS